MKENENNEKKADSVETKSVADEKKTLTPQQLQKRKKMLILPLFFLIFAGSMWLIFAPSGDTKKEELDGFNSDIPMPKNEGIIGDKRDAYEQDAMKRKEQDKMRNLQDFAFMMGETDEESEDYKRQVKLAPVPTDYQEQQNNSRANAFQASAHQYEDINRQLGSFYEEPATEVDEQAQLELQFRIQELERKLEEEDERKRLADEQMALVEKSYQLAAKYNMGNGMQPGENTGQPKATSASGKKAIAQPVSQVRHNVVSLLAAPVPDSEFAEEYSKPRNGGLTRLPVRKNYRIKTVSGLVSIKRLP